MKDYKLNVYRNKREPLEIGILAAILIPVVVMMAWNQVSIYFGF